VDTLRLWRRRRGWTQADLAREAGVHLETISGIEAGRHEPRPSTLQKLASAFGVEVEELFDGPKATRRSSHEASEDVTDEERRNMLRNGREILENIYAKLEDEAAAYKEKGDIDNLELVAAQAFANQWGFTQHANKTGLLSGGATDASERERYIRSLARFGDLGADLAQDLKSLIEDEGTDAQAARVRGHLSVIEGQRDAS
jgi:transcriptional regulator with XRE-family HTH domain